MQWLKFITPMVITILATSTKVNAEENSTRYLNDTIPSHWTYSSTFSQTVPTQDAWWSSFNDSCLDSIIAIGINNNYDLLIAQRRINIARASINVSESNYYPTIGFDAGWIKNRTNPSGNLQSITSDYFSMGLNMSWQIDLFGQITQQVKERKSQWKASKSQYEGAMVALCGNIATYYMQLRIWQAQYVLALNHIKSQKIVCDMTNARFKSGLSSLLDVTQAQTVYYSTLSTLPILNTAIQTQINIIATLIGVYPNEVKTMLESYKTLPDYKQIVSVGIPSELLRRRPDIRTAEYNLAADAAAVGVSKKDFLPMLTINGSVGYDAHNIKNIFKKESLNYTIQPQLTWTVFDGLLRKNSIISAKEQLQISIDNYNLTVMTAYQDVENAMISYRYALQSIEAYNAVVIEANKSLELSIDLYKKGLSDFTNVVNSQMLLLEYSNSLISSQGQALTSLISLYEALGGGWETLSNNN